MKKILALCSSIVCLFLTSHVDANPYYQQHPQCVNPNANPNFQRQCQQHPQCACPDVDPSYQQHPQYVNPNANPNFQQQYQQHPQQVHPCVGRCDQNVAQRQSSESGRFYVGAFGGANWLKFHNKINAKMDTGYTGAVSLGYKFNNGFRMEGEVAYRRNHLKHHLSHGEHENTKISGNVSSWSYMTNFLYDFDCVEHYLPKVVPYVGLGVGYTHIHAHLKAHDHPEHFHAKKTSNGIAGQAIAGVSYRLTDSTSLGVEYRYFMGKAHARDHSVGLALRQSF